MRRRYDSDEIHRADRRDSDRWKKVKLAGIDGGDDPSSGHHDFQGEETGDRGRDAANVPKTSEYAFFKKLKEERHQKSHLHPLHVDDDRAERLWLTNRHRGNGDSSAAVLLEEVIPAQLPTACLPAICISGNPEVSSMPFGFVHDKEVLAVSADFSETLYKPGEIFSRTRKNLLSRITTSSLPEIGELCPKGSKLASVLLSRLTPKDGDTLLLLGLEKSQLVPRVDGEVSYQNPTWEYVDMGGGNYLMDSAFSSGKLPTAVTVASKRITCQEEADCTTRNLDAVFPDAEYDFSSNLAMIEDGYKPFHGLNYEDASWSSGGAVRKGDLSMPFDDWVLEAVESRRFPSDAPGDLMRSPRLPSWTFGYRPLFRNSTSDEEENTFDLSVQSAASLGPYPASLCASCSQDPDYMARLPLLTDDIPSPSSPLSNYPFLAEDCSFYDWIPNESSHRKHRQPCPRPAVESFVISSGFDLRLLSPAGLAGRSGTLTRFPYQVPLPSFHDGGIETLDDSPVGVTADPKCHFYESQFCLHLERSSLYLLTISDREDPWPGLPSILD